MCKDITFLGLTLRVCLILVAVVVIGIGIGYGITDLSLNWKNDRTAAEEGDDEQGEDQ